MGQAHVDYEPTEYEQMLIAAKWIGIENIDPEYQEYARGNADAVHYDAWKRMRHEWDELNDEYKKHIEPYYREYNETCMSWEMSQLEKRLLRQMTELEVMLGY